MKRVRVVKLSGSLLTMPNLKQKFQKWLRENPHPLTLIIVGGGPVVDAVRQVHQANPLSDEFAHWVCIDPAERCHPLAEWCLARYLKGGPIGNSRLLSLKNGQVTFRYRIGTHDGGDGKEQGVTSLPVNTFIRRLLEHVPPRRLQTVRGYGLYSGNQHSQIVEAREALGMPTACKEQQARTWQEICEESGYREMCRCPQCGARLVSYSEFRAGRGPPLIEPSLPNQTEAA